MFLRHQHGAPRHRRIRAQMVPCTQGGNLSLVYIIYSMFYKCVELHRLVTLYWQVTEREVKDFSKAPLPEQGVIMNSAIDIPKRKDKEDLNESSEVQQSFSAFAFCTPNPLLKYISDSVLCRKTVNPCKTN